MPVLIGTRTKYAKYDIALDKRDVITMKAQIINKAVKAPLLVIVLASKTRCCFLTHLTT